MNRRDALKQTALIMGYAVSASTVSAVMAGCKASGDPAWKPAFLSVDQVKVVGAIAETILPKTDTPGALDVGVDEFIDTMLAKYVSEKVKTDFVNGLTAFSTSAQAALGKSYADASAEEQHAHLVKVAEETEAAMRSNTNAGPDAPTPFFLSMKQMTFTGYFTSEKVGKEVLKYEPIPGQYIGCMSLEEATGGMTWTI